MPATIQMPGEQVVLSNEEFLTMLAHELRNPLLPIMNAIHVIENCPTGGNQLLKTSTEILNRQTNYIVGVINDLLDVAKIVKGELFINKVKFNVVETIKRSVEECRTILASRKHELKVKVPEKNIWVMGDSAKIQQVITHLLSNAVKFTETGGKISLTLNYSDDRIIINIHDTGIGIHADSLSSIFTLFSTSPNSPRNLAQGGGMGVGLMLSQKLTEMHGGTIEVSSGGIGTGSEFSIILPLHSVDTLFTEIIRPKKPEANRCLDIMVVDDHIDTAESLATLLKMWGHMVRICHSGTAAIQMAKTYNPEVALLDIGLPGCDGYQVAEKLKEECPNIHLIAVTGYGHCVDRRRSGNAGFQTHLIKPVVPEKLKEALSTLNEAGDG